MQQDRIILVRHGRPSLSRKVWLDWRGYRKWWEAYDAGGLAEEQNIPEDVRQFAIEADLLISSPLRRAMETAYLLRGKAPDLIDDKLVEAALPSPHLGSLKLKPKSWGTVARLAWLAGYSDGMESHKAARIRANEMAENLAEHASGGKTVLVTAHGWYNRMLKGSLMKQGWDCTSQNGDLHWSRRIFLRESRE